MAVAFLQAVPPVLARRPLTEQDAVDIWIARWLRIRRKDLVDRYGCDPRRLYEIWQGERFAGARAKALELFEARYPGLVDRVDFGPTSACPGPRTSASYRCSISYCAGTRRNMMRTKAGQAR